MTISTTFVLGSKEAYFFNTPTHWAWHNLPPDIEALFTKTPAIRDVLDLALGANQSYFVSYRDHDGQTRCKHYNLPNPLVQYLYASHPSVIRDLPSLSIALGPYDSYYAWDRASASWSNVPPGLEKALLNRLESQDAWKTTWKADGYEAPSFVSLGADGAYFMRTVSGGGCWDFKLPKVDGRSGLGTVGGDGWEGIRGTDKFLQDCSSFADIAVSTNTLAVERGAEQNRPCISFPPKQTPTSSSSPVGNVFLTSRLTRGPTMRRWRINCRGLGKGWSLCRLCPYHPRRLYSPNTPHIPQDPSKPQDPHKP